MAVISPSTFNALRRYVGVRLQQGVPIVDADWNELEDIRKFELRTFLKWFIGDGVPEGNDAFRIVGTGATNDFTISAGGGSEGLTAGRCLVDGLDVMITANTTFTMQPMQSEVAALGLPSIDLPAPVEGATVAVYLDVWERLVTSTEEPNLVLPGLGTESCARMKREWAVRGRTGISAPILGNLDYLTGHSYYTLATIVRRASGVIQAGDVTDVREQRLLVPPATLITDLFGGSAADYRRGRNRPAISLRDAINALIRGEIPASPETSIAPALGSDDRISRGSFLDGANGLITVWTSNRLGGLNQIFASSLGFANLNAGFVTPVQITTGAVVHSRPHAVTLSTGEVLVVYETQAANEDVQLKRGNFNTLPSSAEINVAVTPATRERSPFAVSMGAQVALFWHEDTSNTWQFNRFDLATNAFPNPKAALSATTATQLEFHAAKDSTNTTWIAFRTASNDIMTLQLPVAAAPTGEQPLDSGGQDGFPFVLVDASDNVWFFWNAIAAGNISIRYRQFIRATSTWDPPLANSAPTIPGTDTALNVAPAAAIDAEGGIWLFWHSNRVSANQDIWYSRRNPNTRVWGEPRQITGAPEADTNAFALRTPDGAVWLFWNRAFGTNGELFYRRLVTSI